MSISIKWEPNVTVAMSEKYHVRIYTGLSVLARNRIQVLAMSQPREKDALWDALMASCGEIGSAEDSGALARPGVPEFKPFTWWVEADHRAIRLQIGYGFVPNGSKQRGRLHGAFKLVIIGDEEIPDAMTKVFDMERMLRA